MLVVTARDSEVDKVVALRVGADDYLTKPFSLPEFMARVIALLRRGQPPAEEHAPAAVEKLGVFQLDRRSRVVYVGTDELRLSPKEFDLLSFLLAHPGRVHSREHLIRQIWGPHGGSVRVRSTPGAGSTFTVCLPLAS
jgi:two-component system, OmpR family, phosphate regulon response regulator PhoB